MELIKDLQKLKEFINWLPDINAGECYYVSLFARKKYDVTGLIKSDKSQLKRLTSSKELLIQKISQLEISGNYYMDNKPIDESALALYISINPRSFEKAGKNLLIELANKITEPYSNWNPQSLALNSIHKSPSKKRFFDFDFDNISLEELQPLVLNLINADAVTFLQTRGGVHVLIHLDKIGKDYVKTWYQSISKIKECDISGDNLVPIPGCVQGGFVPKLFQNDI
jgi:hypothetical protein